MNNKKIITSAIVVIIVVGIGAFYGGMQYQKSQTPQRGANGGGFVGANGQSRGAGPGGQRMGGVNGANGSFASGNVIAKDDKSVTIKNNDGGSKTVYFSDSTQIGKAVSGNTSDLSVGQQVMANGTNNSDGSLTAQSIQIRPTTPNQAQPQGQ